MSDEKKYESSKVPQLREHGITDWLDEFKGFLMKHKRAHLAISNDRPEKDLTKCEELANGDNPETQLRRYLVKLQEDQDDWDERNDIAISNLIESTNDATNSEARQIIFGMFKNNLSAKDMCSALKSRFDSVDPRVVNAMIKRWSKLKIIPGETATSFITRLQEVKENLRKKGKTYTEGELVGRLLEGLDGEPRYAMNVAALETVKDLSWEDAITQLQNKDTAAFFGSETTTETAAMATSTPKPSTSGGGGERCQICKKNGHSATHCRFRYNNKSEESDKGKGKEDSSSNDKFTKKVKCFNCGKMGHFANQCRLPDKRKGQGSKDDKKRKHGDSDKYDKKRPKSNSESKTNGTGAWDHEEFSGMMHDRA